MLFLLGLALFLHPRCFCLAFYITKICMYDKPIITVSIAILQWSKLHNVFVYAYNDNLRKNLIKLIISFSSTSYVALFVAPILSYSLIEQSLTRMLVLSPKIFMDPPKTVLQSLYHKCKRQHIVAYSYVHSYVYIQKLHTCSASC